MLKYICTFCVNIILENVVGQEQCIKKPLVYNHTLIKIKPLKIRIPSIFSIQKSQ